MFDRRKLGVFRFGARSSDPEFDSPVKVCSYVGSLFFFNSRHLSSFLPLSHPQHSDPLFSNTFLCFIQTLTGLGIGEPAKHINPMLVDSVESRIYPAHTCLGSPLLVFSLTIQTPPPDLFLKLTLRFSDLCIICKPSLNTRNYRRILKVGLTLSEK